MIQVDVFWSFAMGASLATMAGEKLKSEPSIFINSYFVYTVTFLGVIFSPSGVYLLWQHTGWETMFFFGPEDLSGLAVCTFASTNVLLGILGFYVCARLVKAGRTGAAHAVWTTSYVAMFSILSFGYDRFLYAGTLQQWRNGVQYPMGDFFSSEVFYTLLVMSVFVLPPLYYPMIMWLTGPEMDEDRKSYLLRDAVLPYLRVTGIIITVFCALFFADRLPKTWHVDRLVAFLTGQTVFGLFIFLPLYLIPTSGRKPVSPKKVGDSDDSDSNESPAKSRRYKKTKSH